MLLLGIGCQEKTQEKTSRVATLPFYKEATFTPYWLATDSENLTNFHQIPTFELINQNGQTITEKTFANKIYITDFFFTACPGICPKMTKNMGVLQTAFLEKEDVLLLSHSVTPEFDSVSVLKNYAINKDVIDDKWHLVTGDRDHIYHLGRTAYFVEEDLGLEKDPDDFLHTENFVLIDKNRYIRGIYNGLNKAAINQLIADVETLQRE
ncbi:MAG: SCO family protein [Saprospiraceae bacterium]